MKKHQPDMGAAVYLLVIAAIFSLPVHHCRAADFADRVRKPVEESIRIRQETQRAEDKWDALKEKLSAEYALLLQKHGQLADRNGELKKETDGYRAGIRALEKQIEDARRISREIQPYLRDVAARLKEHVAGGPAPYLTEERSERIAGLETLLDDPAVDISEKYRKTMEAVMIEAEYGNTVEVYPEQITIAGQEVRAKIFRLGTVSLFFQSPDGKRCGIYDVAARQWRYLPEKFNRDIGAAVEMGLKRRPVDLVNLPLGRIAVQ